MTAEPAEELAPRQGRSERTREKLIAAAEKLMGERGFDAVSLREIMQAANQRNSNVIQYHFGDKLGLLDAILEWRLEQIADVRQAMLAEAREKGMLGDIKTLLRCAMEPEFSIYVREGSLHYVRLMMDYMIYLRPRGVRHPYDRGVASTLTLRQIFDMMRGLLNLPEERFIFRISALDTMMYSTLISIAQRDSACTESLGILLDDTLDMMVAALKAPPRAGEVR